MGAMPHAATPTTIAPAPVARATPDALAGRDLVVDLARVGAVLLVVVIHVLFAGVRLTDVGVEVEHTVELQPWFDAATWVLEIMPLFFVVGGFASATALRSAYRRGETATAFVRGRLRRLARPALPVFAFFASALLAARALPIDPALVSAVAVAVGSPLWFLASFLVVQALAPVLLRAHERRPGLALAALVGAAGLVDAVRAVTGDPRVGLANVVFVWAAVHQLGFWMRDGWFARRSRPALVAIIAASYLALWGLVATGAYDTNMLANQYPPTLPLVCLGAAQAAGLQLARPVLERVTGWRWVRAVMFLVGSRAMTVYCWHSPAIMLLLGAQLLVPASLSEPGSARWWVERIPFTALVLGVVWLLSLPLARLERLPERDASPERASSGRAFPGLPARTALACLAFVAAPSCIAQLGMDAHLAIAGLAGTSVALWLVRAPRPA